MLFEHYKEESSVIKAVCTVGMESNVSKFIRQILKSFYEKFVGSSDDLLDYIEETIHESALDKARKSVLDISSKRPVIISFDTLENYSINDDHMMFAVSSLIQFASNFSQKYVLRYS